MDTNQNGIITRSEVKNLTPLEAAADRTVVKTVVKDPVYVDIIEVQGGKHVVETQTGVKTSISSETHDYIKNKVAEPTENGNSASLLQLNN